MRLTDTQNCFPRQEHKSAKLGGLWWLAILDRLARLDRSAEEISTESTHQYLFLYYHTRMTRERSVGGAVWLENVS